MNEPKRILCVFGCLDRGGAETMCMNLYRHVDRTKVQFDFVTHFSKPGAYDEEIRSLGGRIYTAPRFKGWNLLAYQAWWKQHLEQHPEHQIIHGHYFSISGLYFAIAKRFHRTTVAHSHATSLLPKHKRIEQFFLSLMNRYADYRLACSEAAGRFLFRGKDFTVIKNAIDTERFSYDPKRREAARKDFALTDELVIGTVGRMEQVKNPFGMLTIFSEVLKQEPQAALLWVGDGPLREAVEQRAEELGIADRIHMTGIRSDVDNLLQAMDVFLLPSISEGLPVSAIEAQAAGLPCVLSDGISRETAITDRCRFVPLDNPDAWVRAIEDGFRRGRSDTTQAIIDAGYDIRTTAAWLQDFYLHILEEPEERRGL